jgi:hypothetical protein
VRRALQTPQPAKKRRMSHTDRECRGCVSYRLLFPVDGGDEKQGCDEVITFPFCVSGI